MSKLLLDYLVRIFAIIATIYPTILVENIKLFIRAILKKDFPPDILNNYINLYEKYYLNYSELKKSSNEYEFLFEILKETTKALNKELPKKYRYLILIRLLLFENYLVRFSTSSKQSEQVSLSDILKQISDFLKISADDFYNSKAFISGKLFDIKNKEDILIISEKKFFNINVHFIERKNLLGQLYFFKIKNFNTILFYYKGTDSLSFNGHAIFPENIYILTLGSSIKSEQIEPIYYNQILRQYLAGYIPKLEFDIENLEFRFRNSNNGIHQLTMSLKAGQLVGIIGRSGVGKSTLLSLLNGTLPPLKGNIKINNYDINQDKEKIEGLIGYIPQDDLLVEELTVFENLLLSSQLCLGNLPSEQITEKVYNLLIELDLFDICNLKVGTPLNKFISGGQRKRLNIALELIREPWILFADEPTSGLSSSDAEEIMKLFVDQTVKGRIVIMNIHQPSSDNFKIFDSILVLDKEGHPVYFGDPVDSITYFNSKTGSFVKSADSCENCGNINHEAIFRILGEKKVDDFGNVIEKRKISHKNWHQFYLQRVEEKKNAINEKISGHTELPNIQFTKPKPLKQLKVFSKRNILSKLANNQYILLSLLVSPILALLLSILCRSGIDPNGENPGYIFAFNKNIPSYMFMSVIVALFIGLIISAEEIYKDRKILKREAFLKLDKKSYLLSKLSFLFFLSLIQTFFYVLIGNLILEVKGMLLIYWLILFSTSCFANVMGLLISSIFNSVVVIYILVPILIVPQLLLSGVVVQYDQLNKNFVSQENVPVVGDLTASRWAYEALVVSQFRYNKYQKNFFRLEMEESNNKFDLLFVIPELKNVLGDIRKNQVTSENVAHKREIDFLKNELVKLNRTLPFKNIENINHDKFTGIGWMDINNYLNTAKKHNQKKINEFSIKKDKITHSLQEKLGNYKAYTEYKNKYYNSKLTEIVLNRSSFETFIKHNNKIIRKIEPIYQIPDSKFGRAHFFSSIKRIGNLEIDTLFFNIMIIWLMTFITTFLLYLLFNKKTF